VCPWIENPYSLTSWWKMEKFAAANFYDLTRFLSYAQVYFRQQREKYGEDARMGPSTHDSQTEHSFIVKIERACKELDLKISLRCVQRISYQTNHGATYTEAIEAAEQLERTISWEMEDKLFMYVPPDRAALYNQSEMFGLDVNAKFPTIQYDMVEAGNCYATGRCTAVVFHLMRIMETAVQEFGKKLGVALVNEKNWHNILDEINREIGKLPAGPSRVDMAQASANLYAVKLAWRNEVMHPKDTYTLEEADNLIRQVKIFMEQLAKL